MSAVQNPRKAPHRSKPSATLHAGMSAQAFDEGYFYAAELKAFARELGIIVGNRRKVELEQLIRQFLTTGRVSSTPPVLPRTAGEPRDRLAPDVLVKNYVGDKTTKAFLLACVQADHPGLPAKSGQWYWLNDWRRTKQQARTPFTYAELARRLGELMQTAGRLPQIPSARMNNFITDYRADPANPRASRDELMKEWQWLKQQPGPKTYAEYRRRKPHARSAPEYP